MGAYEKNQGLIDIKAVIFNSGLGKRMGKLTENSHKSMVRLQNGEAIFERQLRLLHECGIRDFVVTTGPFAAELESAAKNPLFSDSRFTFVPNPVYDSTNYIYSMYLAREAIAGGDVLLLHGDLVFSKSLARDIIGSTHPSLGCVNRQKALPEKDFKARVKNGLVTEVSINIFDGDCFAFQPFYKLSAQDIGIWLGRVEEFVKKGDTGVYAENALNTVAPDMHLHAFGYEDYYIDEVDNPADLERVSSEIRGYDYEDCQIISGKPAGAAIAEILAENCAKKPLLVCGKSFFSLPESGEITRALGDYAVFGGFSANPKYEDIEKGVELFRTSGCDIIVAVGGGSAMDTAKCIKLFAPLDAERNYLTQGCVFSPVKLLAVPTTAGTGSESTRFAVMYYKGEKQSVAHDTILPDYAVLLPQLLKKLPLYQKKSTLMDALCQAIESFWSVNSTPKSMEYASRAVVLILESYADYLEGCPAAAEQIMLASNFAGRAINITQTTAAHAMCYKITTLFNVPHGHAVAMCLPVIWEYMLANTALCIDARGEAYLKAALSRLEEMIDIGRFCSMMEEMELARGVDGSRRQLETMVAAVNVDRLKNNPVGLSEDAIRSLYERIVKI